jgi:hypothetical protein
MHNHYFTLIQLLGGARKGNKEGFKAFWSISMVINFQICDTHTIKMGMRGPSRGETELEWFPPQFYLYSMIVNTTLVILLFIFTGFDPLLLVLFLPQYLMGLAMFSLGRKILFVLHGWLTIPLGALIWICLSKKTRNVKWEKRQAAKGYDQDQNVHQFNQGGQKEGEVDYDPSNQNEVLPARANSYRPESSEDDNLNEYMEHLQQLMAIRMKLTAKDAKVADGMSSKLKKMDTIAPPK